MKEKTMLKNQEDTTSYVPAGTSESSISLGKIEEYAQVTANDTGWTEEEKERMTQFGYDGLDMVRAWYS